jgi:hypothetical protein
MLEGVAGVSPGSGHIVGLCHDLAEIFVRQRFPETFVCAADAAASAGVPIAKVFPDIFGMSYGDLTVEMMKWTQLPPEIARPIDQYHRLGSSGSDANPVVRALRIADLQASGLLLISSPQELVAPLLASEAKPPQCPPSAEAQRLRAEVLINFYMLSGVPMGKDSEFTRPLLPKSSAKILYIRPPEFSPCDPLENAMRLLGDVELVADPIAAKLAKFEGIVMACPAGAAASPLLASLRQLLEDGESVPTLLLGDRATLAANPTNKMREFPLLLSDLHQFIAGVKENRPLQPA